MPRGSTERRHDAQGRRQPLSLCLGRGRRQAGERFPGGGGRRPGTAPPTRRWSRHCRSAPSALCPTTPSTRCLPGGVLWANGFAAGRTFRLDLREPSTATARRILRGAGPVQPSTQLCAAAERECPGHLSAPRSTRSRLPRADWWSSTPPVKWCATRAAAAPRIDSTVRPYSLAVVPSLDRVVTTATDMHLRRPEPRSAGVATIRPGAASHAPAAPRPAGRRELADRRAPGPARTAAPCWSTRSPAGSTACAAWRVMRRGRSGCTRPRGRRGGTAAVPVVAGQFWLQPSGPGAFGR